MPNINITCIRSKILSIFGRRSVMMIKSIPIQPTTAALESAIDIAIEEHRVWSPMSPTPPMPLSETASLPQHLHSHMRAPDLLIVDDDDYFVGVLKRHLRPQGYGMRSACTVDQAIDSTKATPPDLILLDIKLPVANGWWLAEWLQTSKETAAIPVIVLTGLADSEVQAKAQSYGTFACLAKPVVTDVLLETVQDALSWHKKQ
jgi:CheY-like chemotaxis protein